MISLGQLQYILSIDSKTAEAELKRFDKSLKNYSIQAEKIGKSLTKNLTLPLIGALGVATKLAIDYEVAARKFMGTFKGAEDEAAAAVANLTENFNLANSEATALMAFTGDLLRGFQATASEAANLSEEALELAASIAAFNGIPVKQAADAITKAMIGERESLKMLGVAIREADVNQQLLIDGTSELTGEALLLAKAEATLTIASRQSAVAVGEFANNQDTLSAKMAKTLASAKNLGVELGTVLLPMLKDIIDKIGEGVEWFSELDDSTKKTIVNIALMAAAIGPAITTVVKITKAVKALKVALAGPAGLAIAAGTLAVAGIVALNKAIQKSEIERRYSEAADEMRRMAEETKDSAQFIKDFAKETGVSLTRAIELADEEGLITDQIREQVGLLKGRASEEGDVLLTLEQELERREDIEHMIRLGAQSAVSFGTASQNAVAATQLLDGQLRGIADQYDISLRKALDIAMASGITNKNYISAMALFDERLAQDEQHIDNLETQAKAEEEIERKRVEQENARLARVEARRIAEEEAREAEIKTAEDLRILKEGISDAYSKSMLDSQAKYNLGLIDETELLQNKIAATDTYVNKMIESGVTDEEILGSYIDSIKIYEGKIQDIIDLKEEQIALDNDAAAKKIEEDDAAQEELSRRVEMNKMVNENLLRQTEDKLAILRYERDEQIKLAEELGADVQAVRDYWLQEELNLQKGFEEEKRAIAQEAQDEENAVFEEEKKARDDRLEDISDFQDEWTLKVAQQSGDRVFLLAEEKKEAIEIAEELGQDTLAIEEYYANESNKIQLDKFKKWVNIAANAINMVEDFHNTLLETELNNIEIETQAKISSIDKEKIVEDATAQAEADLLAKQKEDLDLFYQEKAEMDQEYNDDYDELINQQLKEVVEFNKRHNKNDADYYEKYNSMLADHEDEIKVFTDKKKEMDEDYVEGKEELDAAQATAHTELLDNELLGEQEYQDEVSRLEAEAAQAKYEMELEAFETKKMFNRAEVLMNTASAVMKAYAELGAVGGSIAAFIIAGIGLKKLSLIDSTPPPRAPDFTKFADGGIVNNPGQGVKSIIGEAGPEAILPLNDKTLSALGKAIARNTVTTNRIENSSSSMILNLNIEGMGEMTIPITQDALDNQRITVQAATLV